MTLPHVVTRLSWCDWDPESWEREWIYRRRLSVALGDGERAFLDFDGVLGTATVSCNGIRIGSHAGGYVPFAVELTDALVADGDNEIEVLVDGRGRDVPPGRRADAVDFLQPAGIHREVALRVVPRVHVTDVWVRPIDVLGSPRLEVVASVEGSGTVEATLVSGDTEIAAASASVGEPLALDGLRGVSLWSPEEPVLYDVRVRVGDHVVTTRTGFRSAVFRTEGFLLNGHRRPLFGLNRHGLFPYLGMAAPRTLQRRDAEILRDELSCDMVRCSHYPQSPHFLDACDELGLMVWQETPGWQRVGGRSFRALVRRDVAAMVRRDRNRPSVIAWGTRLNESRNVRSLYRATRRIAASLDPGRPSTGAMDRHSTRGWTEEVFGYDDYSSVDGRRAQATLAPPLRGVPYLVSEAVGALSGAPRYRWTDPPATLALQAAMHARVHSLARSEPGYAGLLGWCGFDYPSLNGGDRVWRSLKTPGVADVFRVGKPAAGFYASQRDPSRGPVIEPAFADAGVGGPVTLYTNCDRLELFAGDDDRPVAVGVPDAAGHPGLAHPPVLVDLPPLDELRVDGFVGDERVVTRAFSLDRSRDRLLAWLDHDVIVADGSDMTRVTAVIVDVHANRRHLAADDDRLVTFALSGPGTFVGDNPFPVGAYGGVAGGFVRSRPDETGQVRLTAKCPGLPPVRNALEVVAGRTPPARGGAGPPAIVPSR